MLTVRSNALLAAPLALILSGAATWVVAEESRPMTEVRGIFCDSDEATIAFLRNRAEGESEIIAANSVNKAMGKQVCAEFLPAMAIVGEEKTVMQDGLVFTIQSYIFQPENVTRWTGSYYGSLPRKNQKRGI